MNWGRSVATPVIEVPRITNDDSDEWSDRDGDGVDIGVSSVLMTDMVGRDRKEPTFS